MKRILAALWLVLAGFTPVLAQTDPDSLAVINAAQSLPETSEQAMYWLEVSETGLYDIRLDKPGLLHLYVFDTEDGRFGGDQPRLLLQDGGRYSVPVLQDVLLPAGSRYLLLAKPAVSAALTISATEIPGPALEPQDETPLPAGDSWQQLYRIGDRVYLSFADGITDPVHIRVIGEPRAEVSATLDYMHIHGDLFPMVLPAEATLDIFTSVQAGPEPLVLLQMSPDDSGLDEREPNADSENGEAQEYVTGTDFRGVLLAGRDEDVLQFQLEDRETLTLTAQSPLEWAQYTAVLEKNTGDDWITLAERGADRGALRFSQMVLGEGTYRLTLVRRDDDVIKPVPYTVSSQPVPPPPAGFEQEPNDTFEAAYPLPQTLALRGVLSEENRDFIGFDIPRDGHLWRLFAVRGVNRMILRDRDGDEIMEEHGDSGQLLLDSLSLGYGHYVAELRGTGKYALKLLDLGPVPEGYEAELNDRAEDGLRIAFGNTYKGSFLNPDDSDFFVFRLDATTPVEISLTAPDDQFMRVKLRQDGRVWDGQAEIPRGQTYTYAANLPAGDYALELSGSYEGGRGTYALGIDRVAQVSTHEPDSRPETLRAMPLNGDVQGRVGMIDSLDLWHVALPEGSGQFMIGCAADSVLTWRMLSYTDGESLVYGREAPEVLSYSPEMGGALQLKIEGDSTQDQSYDCNLRFAPDQALEPVIMAKESDTPLPVQPGTRVRGWLADDRDRDVLAVNYPDGMAGGFVCRDAAGGDLYGYDGVEYASGFEVGDDPFANGVQVFRGRSDRNPEIRLSGKSDLDFPFAYTCDFYTLADMPTLRDAGPLAPFTALETKAAENDEDPPVVLPPLLQPGRPDWIPAFDSNTTLPLAFDLTGFETPLATYTRSGQQLDVVVTLTNTGDTDITGQVSAKMLAEGWRVALPVQDLTLAGGESRDIPVALQAPPMLSPSLKPALAVTFDNDDGASGAVFDVPLALDAPARNPFAYWSAPEQMRGGLNVLNYYLGARITRWDDETVDEDRASDYSFLHDGLAMHSSLQSVGARTLEFRLPETAPVVGAVFQLRSAEPREDWAAGYALAVSGDGSDWQTVAEGRLNTGMAPQYVPFAEPVQAKFLRLRVPGCQADPDCSRFFLPEVQLIAKPGWTMPGPLNIANPDLGGHVVYATDSFSGSWNVDLLDSDRGVHNFRERDERWPDTVDAVIAFEQDRAAQVSRILWRNAEARTPSFPFATVYVSTDTPNGPWQQAGVLPAPAEGALQSVLDLETPVWARYVRLSFPRGEDTLYGPDMIEIFEAPPALPVLGLWEDDSPLGPFEYSRDIAPHAAPAPIGGATRETAKPLPMDRGIASSVLIERNADWWTITVPEGQPHQLTLDFGQDAGRPEYVWQVEDSEGNPVPFTPDESGRENVFVSVLAGGVYTLNIHEPPRSVVITWDTSGSVSDYIPKTLEAVRIWSKSLQPGRDSLQLLPFGSDALLMENWADTPDDVLPYLADLPADGSSDSETAMMVASKALQARDGARGIVIITDAETSMVADMWPEALAAMPRVVAMSIDSSERENTNIMMDWANINGGVFHRVVGVMGLADGMDMAAALFRAPKPYTLHASLDVVAEPEGEGSLTISALVPTPEAGEEPAATGGIEVILDASGSMLKRMGNGERRIKVAHSALEALVKNSLPEGTPFAFRAFGLQKDACLSELVLPLGPLDRRVAAQAIKDVPAINLAKTAIAKSLLAAREDLANASEPRVVVLVTDGEETCDGDVGQAIETLRSGGFDVRINIVGFAIDDAELADTFAAWAKQGGGAYFEARQADALADAVARAIAPRFNVTRIYYDGTEEPLMNIGAGETVTVPAGRLRITPATAAVGEPILLEVRDSDKITVGYNPSSGLSGPQ